jgi:phosphate transport system substrate-binding protein
LFSTALLTGVVSAQVLINGAGATFPYPVYSKWFNQYHQKSSNVQINYQSQGSGAGIRQVTEGTVDFGATDGPMNEEQLKQFQSKRGSGVLHFPTVMGADVIVYNLPGVSKELSFTPEAIAGIFLGTIKKWNDPELAKSNPGVNLPGSDIVVVHRSDGSGTTYVFVDYLSKVSKEWETKVGRGTSVNWPVGLGGKGNEGVAGQIKQTPNSIGYIELIYAIQNKMSYGNVKNAAGKFIRPSTASVTAAAAGALKEMPEDFRVSITNAPGKESYPISSFTWLLIPARIQDPAKKKALVDFLRWMLDNDAQATAEGLDYARLPQAVVAKEIKAISKIQ